MEDVAREAGVSRALVSIAYRGVSGVSSETRARIIAAGNQLGYVPNRVAAQLASKGGNVIGVFLQDLHNEVFADVYDGIRAVTAERGLHLVIAVGEIDGGLDRESLETLLAGRVDVIIAAGLILSDDELGDFGKRVPLVSVSRTVPGVDSVASDDERGAGLATNHLIDLGHRRIAFLANPQTDGYLGRQLGFERTMVEHGLVPRVHPTTYSREQAAVDAGHLLDAPEAPTAILAHNDHTALGVLDALAIRQLVPGVDVSVVGYDNTSASQAPGSALTSVDVHSVDLGQRAARMALDRLAKPSRRATYDVSEPTLVIRASTGRAKI